MKLWKRLWSDEAGVVLSAEAVLLGTVGVLGAVAGLSTISHAVDGELRDVGFAIRSLDQSYCYTGHSSCWAWTAGSSFIQPPVETALADLSVQSEADAKAFQQKMEAYRKQTDSAPAAEPEKAAPTKKKPKTKQPKTVKIDESTLRAEPNDLPTTESADSSL